MYIFLLWSAIGTLWHYLYDFANQSYLIGLIAPVNESVWEHMKLAFFPGLIIYLIFKNTHKITLRTILIATWLIPILFYTYSGFLGFTVTIIDILVFFISVGVALTLTRRNCQLPSYIVLALIILQALAFMYFTYNPLDIGIFNIPD